LKNTEIDKCRPCFPEDFGTIWPDFFKSHKNQQIGCVAGTGLWRTLAVGLPRCQTPKNNQHMRKNYVSKRKSTKNIEKLRRDIRWFRIRHAQSGVFSGGKLENSPTRPQREYEDKSGKWLSGLGGKLKQGI
jgi:hypothetical protein